MVAKLTAFIINLGLACVLVLLTVSGRIHAQENPAGSANADTSLEVSIELSGRAMVRRIGNLRVSPAEFGIGNLDVGESATRSVTLSHTGAAGSAPVIINSASLDGHNASEFTLDFGGSISLAPGQAHPITVSFVAAVAGEKSAAVKLDIQGATAPYIIMIQGSARDPLTSKLIAQATLNLGQAVLSKPAVKKLTLTNDSAEADAPPVEISASTLSGDTPGDFSHDLTPRTLAPGQSTTINVQMKSAQEGHKAADLTIEHNGVNNPLSIALEGDVVEPSAIPVNFSVSTLGGATIQQGTSLQFGPDGKLYVAQETGRILIFNVQRNGPNNYNATLSGTITAVENVQNHNDSGAINNGLNTRLVTGILVTGSAANPVIYTQSSDPRFGGGTSGTDSNLDTNSGILHKLVKNGNNWNRIDLVRGLPRSEENHQGNGMVMLDGKLLMAQGGNTNMGAPSNNFAELPEFALSSAILEFDLAALGNNTYDLPTLDAPNDNNDPFGGNNGLNQAILEANGPVKIYAPGFRNAYDLVLTESGRLYTVDNGPNAKWGGEPAGNCTNQLDNSIQAGNTGQTLGDGLHHVAFRGYYGGHPNPTRGNKNNTFNAGNPQTPIQGAENPLECQYKKPGTEDGALTVFSVSTNGLAEYTAFNFGGAMKGDLLAAGYRGIIHRLQLNASGTAVTSKSNLKDLGGAPLDVIAQGDNDPFPGTVWVVVNDANTITVLEPVDY